MQRTTTLFVIDQDTPDEAISAQAEAAVETETHLSCLLLARTPTLPIGSFGALPYGSIDIPDHWADTLNQTRRAQSERRDDIDTLLSRSGTFGSVQSVMCVTSELSAAVARQARVSDVACLAPNLRDAPEIEREAAYGVLFQSPAGLMLNGSPSSHRAKVFVAWNSSAAAARAAHVALPYLKGADEVVIGCFDPVTSPDQDGADPGTDIASWLSHHGCHVTLTQYPSGGQEIGKCIQDRAVEAGADLVVMGAYGHARMIQAVFGGTTRTMMAQTRLPVLMAH